MKRILTFAACAAAVLASISCEKSETKPTVEFSEKITSINIGGTVEVSAVLDKAAEAAVTVPVDFSGSAVKGTAYTVSSEAFVFAEGSTKASITITDVAMASEEQIVLKLTGSEAVIGTNFTCVVTLNADESLIYNFDNARTEVVESATLTITVEGVESGKSFKAPADIELPLKVEGEAEKFLDYPASVTLAKGTNSVRFEVKARESSKTDENERLEDYPENPSAVIFVSGDRFIGGDKPEATVKLHSGQLVPEKLVGKWAFNHVYDEEDYEYFFELTEPELLPIHNDGFEIEIYIDEDDDMVKIKSNNTGDFAHFFRDGASISLTTPINSVAGAVPVGKYAMKEGNMYRDTELESEAVIWFYYKLSSANKSFSAEPDEEIIGESTIALRLDDDGRLEMQFRDLINPPFGDIWWEELKPDYENLGFCSVFDPVK